MASSFDAVVSSWPAQPGLAISLLITAAIYLRGWLVLRRRDPSRWNFGRLAAFTTGLGMLYLAMASPIEAFAALLLQVHMVQHLLLMMVAPPLVWLGAPMLPLLHGVPIEVRRYWIVPLIHWRPLRQVMAAIAHPLGALIVIIAATWIWHFPTLYQMALANDNWHIVQHICFFTAGLIFWHAVIRPFPARPSWPTWLLVPLLLLADIQNTIFSALLTFSSGIWYPHYAQMPRIGGISAIDDQAAAGVTMWVPGSIAFLLPLAWIGLGLLFPARGHNSRMRPPNRATVVHDHRALDLLRVALLGRVLRWSWTRRIVQSLVLLAAIAVIVDGLGGPQIAPMNLAGVVPWIHWRGLVVIGLLIAGNVFCYGCPFTLPRTIARKLFGGLAQFDWPKRLRTKWLAVALLVVFLWSFEAFSLWDSPWLTAWIAIAYFVGALVIDSIFREAAFCKFVCPIGQFNFVQSLISPLEVKVRESAICTTCRTHDCIRGRTKNQLQILPGCELQLFQPRKVGNLDCTFCLDCVQACPHENIGVIAVPPAASLWNFAFRSGIGRLSRRADYAALAILLCFGAFANAAGMVAPVVSAERAVCEVLDWSMSAASTAFYGLVLIVIPAIGICIAAAFSRLHVELPIREIVCRFAWSFVPLGFAMWLAHYSFHFFTSFDTVIPATQRFAADFRLASIGKPDWICSCCRPAPDWLLKAELLSLDVGLLVSLYAAWRIAQSMARSLLQNFRVVAPWAILLVGLFACGVWILLQPMEMRGTLPVGIPQ